MQQHQHAQPRGTGCSARTSSGSATGAVCAAARVHILGISGSVLHALFWIHNDSSTLLDVASGSAACSSASSSAPYAFSWRLAQRARAQTPPNHLCPRRRSEQSQRGDSSSAHTPWECGNLWHFSHILHGADEACARRRRSSQVHSCPRAVDGDAVLFGEAERVKLLRKLARLVGAQRLHHIVGRGRRILKCSADSRSDSRARRVLLTPLATTLALAVPRWRVLEA